jgi:hypothetical protein
VLDWRDCQFRNGSIGHYFDSGAGRTWNIINNLFDCINYRFGTETDPVALNFYNNTFLPNSPGWFMPSTTPNWIVRDNLWAQANVWQTGNTMDADWNSYVNSYQRLTVKSPTHDTIISDSPAWQTASPGLGSRYLPSGHALLNAGSRTANLAGLYHHTTTTDQAKEASSTVDIGFHYVAVNGSSLPLDSDGDGLPDYLEDTNGNGSPDTGETDWQNSENGTTGAPGLQVFTWLE